jgi:hypothetical protein
MALAHVLQVHLHILAPASAKQARVLVGFLLDIVLRRLYQLSLHLGQHFFVLFRCLVLGEGRLIGKLLVAGLAIVLLRYTLYFLFLSLLFF